MIEVNYIAILIAAIVSMALGFLWYSPMVLGKPWMKLKGYTQESLKKEQKEMTKYYALSFLLAFVTAYILSHVIALSLNFYGFSRVSTGVTTAFWMWLGFIMPVQLTASIFGDKKWDLFGIDTGYQLVSVLAMGIVIGLL